MNHLAGEPTLRIQWAGEVLDLPGGGFVQVNPGAGEALFRHVLLETGDVRGKKVIDAYCGAGVLGRAMAGGGGNVIGVDIDPAGAVADHQATDHGFSIVRGLVEEELGALLPADLVLLNPPRTGLADAIPLLLSRQPPKDVVYVSCDPATLARDLMRLGEAFEVLRVRSFDLFPQTGHVETVVTLRASAP